MWFIWFAVGFFCGIVLMCMMNLVALRDKDDFIRELKKDGPLNDAVSDELHKAAAEFRKD